MNIFSELFVKHLAKTLFFISIGVSSSICQHILTKNILHNETTATAVAVVWATLLVMIYSFFRSQTEAELQQLKDSFEYHRILRPDNKISAVTNVDKADSAVSNFSKIEIQHTMEPVAKTSSWPKEEKPEWLKDSNSKDKK